METVEKIQKDIDAANERKRIAEMKLQREAAIKEATGEDIKVEGQVLDQKASSRPQVSVDTVREIFEGELM